MRYKQILEIDILHLFVQMPQYHIGDKPISVALKEQAITWSNFDNILWLHTNQIKSSQIYIYYVIIRYYYWRGL